MTKSQRDLLSLRGCIWSTLDLGGVPMDIPGIHPVLAKILSARAIEDVPLFLSPTIKSYMPTPFVLLDMDKAVDRVVTAVANNEIIGLFGDYDVDGATSCAVMFKFLTALGLSVSVHIPDRFKEGYGLNVGGLGKLIADGASVCITLDCGSTSHDEAEWAANNNLDLIIIDHHITTNRVPKCVAMVNPNRQGDSSGLRNLAAVGVAFLFIVAINSKLTKPIDRRALYNLLDLVALGTVCDVMELRGLNRAYVSAGLKVIAQRTNFGLNALIGAAGLAEESSLNAGHLGYILGPRINAGGRLGESYLGFELLTRDADKGGGDALAYRANVLSQHRATIEDALLQEAVVQADGDTMIMVSGDSWHIGVIGIIAGRLKEMFHLPVAVVSICDGVGRASCRSVSGINFGAAITEAKEVGLLINGGGHAMAGGFTVDAANVSELRDFFINNFKNQAQERVITARSRQYDAEIMLSDLTLEFVEALKLLEPCGVGNPAPRMLLKDVMIENLQLRRDKHVFFDIAREVRGVMFRLSKDEISRLYTMIASGPVDLIGHLGINEYKGNKLVQFTIDDVLCTELVDAVN